MLLSALLDKERLLFRAMISSPGKKYHLEFKNLPRLNWDDDVGDEYISECFKFTAASRIR